MPTRVEEICKRIHILFAKGETYQNSPDLVILSKTELFALLEELNEAMYEVLDQYEATSRAKEKAKLETEREASEIITKAKLGAEDVQAASLAYTDTMLDEVNAFLENTAESIRKQYLEFLSAMDVKKSDIAENREQIKDQLSRLHDNEVYLEMLDEIREERALKEEEENEDLVQEEEKTGKTPEYAKSKNTKETVPESEADEFPPAPKPPAPVIRVNRPGENPGVTFTTRRSHNKKSKTAPPKSARTKTMSEEEYNRLSPEEQLALEQSTPAYGQGFTADDFDLDAEYEQFKLENEAAQNQNNSSKKNGFKIFNKKKK